MNKLENSLDWPVIKTEIQVLSRTLPAFHQDFSRFCVYLENEVKILANLEVTHRRMHSKNSLSNCVEQTCVINNVLNNIQQIHLMSLLSQ